jgi:hypothetical protein
MLNLSDLEKVHADIEAVHEIVHMLRARIDGKEIAIHILRNPKGHYFFELSHYYRNADSADPDTSSVNSFETIEEAARGALKSAAMYYRSTDEGGSWMRNESFLQ